jgi:hypothetical protein
MMAALNRSPSCLPSSDEEAEGSEELSLPVSAAEEVDSAPLIGSKVMVFVVISCVSDCFWQPHSDINVKDSNRAVIAFLVLFIDFISLSSVSLSALRL